MHARLITRSAHYAALHHSYNLFRITVLARISKCPMIPGESPAVPSQWNRAATRVVLRSTGSSERGVIERVTQTTGRDNVMTDKRKI